MKKIVLTAFGLWFAFAIGWYGWNWEVLGNEMDNAIPKKANDFEVERQSDDSIHVWGWKSEADNPGLVGDTLVLKPKGDPMKLEAGKPVPLTAQEKKSAWPYVQYFSP